MISLVFGLLCFFSTLIVLIDAFKASVLKGFLCLICCFYYFYYALFEFRHESKFWIVLASFLGGGVAGAFRWLGR